MFAPVVRSYKEQGAKRKTQSVATALGYSRQYYYKHVKEKAEREKADQQIVSAVKEKRKLLPRLGTRKLHYMLGPLFASSGLKCGRDKLFRLLGDAGILITPKKRYVQTTDSKHWMRKYPNIAKDEVAIMPEQLWVSDITYIKTHQGNCYLNLVTDAYSRKIVGYSIKDNMETESMIGAYQTALATKKCKDIATIHHSDRGLQYCSREYVQLSIDNGCRISMTENGDPYENALAERMNRTLKDEFGLGEILKTKEIAYRLVEEAVYLYNNVRPHCSLNYQTPEQVHKKNP